MSMKRNVQGTLTARHELVVSDTLSPMRRTLQIYTWIHIQHSTAPHCAFLLHLHPAYTAC